MFCIAQIFSRLQFPYLKYIGNSGKRTTQILQYKARQTPIIKKFLLEFLTKFDTNTYKKKSRIRETKNLLTDANNSTDNKKTSC